MEMLTGFLLCNQVFATLNGLLTRQPFAVGGSGSSYVYGFVDAEYRKGMSKEEAQQFVVNSEFIFTLWKRNMMSSLLRSTFSLLLVTFFDYITQQIWVFESLYTFLLPLIILSSLSWSTLSGHEPWWLQWWCSLYRHYWWTQRRGESHSRKWPSHILWSVTSFTLLCQC